jgi:hypothetical protein
MTKYDRHGLTSFFVVDALNFMASLVEMVGKDSPACEDLSISTLCNQTLCILIQTMAINSYKI